MSMSLLKRTRMSLLFVATALSLLGASLAFAGTAAPGRTALAQTTGTFCVTDDAFVEQLNPDSNFGDVLRMEVDTVRGDERQERIDTYIKFDLSSIPAGATLTSATLRLQVRSSGTNGTQHDINVHAVADTSWSESTLTWNTRPTLGGVLAVLAAPMLPGDAVSAGLPVGFYSGPGLYSFGLAYPAEDRHSDGIDFVTKEDPTSDAIACLDLVYTTGGAANLPPTIAPIGDQTMTASESRTLTILATDPEGGALTYGASSSDAGIVAVSVAGNQLTLLAGAVTVTSSVTVTVTASDGVNPAASRAFTVTVNPAQPGNTAPVIADIADQTMLVGATLDITLQATDAEGDPLTFSATSLDGAVASASVAGDVLTLNALAAGATTVTVTATDTASNQDTESFVLTVTKPGQPEPPQPPVGQPPATPPQGPAPVPFAHYAMEPAQLCADPSGLTNPAVRAAVPGDAVSGGHVYCRVLAEDGAFLNPLDAARLGDPGLIEYGVITAVEVFAADGNGSADPTFAHAVTICLEGAGRFIYLSALNSPRTTFEMPPVVDGDYTCATIPAAGTVVLIPALPQD